MTGLLAHQGGWDEALFVLLPLAAFVAILWAARRRADEEEPGDVPADGPTDSR